MALRLRIDGAAPESSSRQLERDSFASKLNSKPTAFSQSSSTQAAQSGQSVSAGRQMVDSINENIAQTAVQAAAAVLNLREREKTILKQSENSAYGDGTIARQGEAATIETEIARISTSATYNGINALTGRTLTGSSTATSPATVIALPSFASELTTSANLSNQTPSNAASGYKLLSTATISVASLLSSYENAANVASTSGASPKISFDTPVADSLRDGEQAQELARKIAATFVSPYATDKQRLTLIEMSSSALDESTVHKLIA